MSIPRRIGSAFDGLFVQIMADFEFYVERRRRWTLSVQFDYTGVTGQEFPFINGNRPIERRANVLSAIT